MWWVSALAILLFSSPVIVGAVRWLGPRGGIGLLLALGLYALVVESVAVATGLPYGRFSYSQVLGPPLLGLAPPTVLLAWTPLILGALAMTRRAWAAVALLVAVDLVLDPAAVRLGFWSWDEPGIYYGVPLINFFGWVLSGGIAVLALRRLPRPRARPVRPEPVAGAGVLVLGERCGAGSGSRPWSVWCCWSVLAPRYGRVP